MFLGLFVNPLSLLTGVGKLNWGLGGCDSNVSPSTITNSGLLTARLDDSEDERA